MARFRLVADEAREVSILPTGTLHERVATPSTCTVQAPH